MKTLFLKCIGLAISSRVKFLVGAFVIFLGLSVAQASQASTGTVILAKGVVTLPLMPHNKAAYWRRAVVLRKVTL